MKTIKYTMTVLFAIIASAVFSQSTINGPGTQGHNATGTTNTYYLGWLDNDIPLEFRTNNNRRMSLARNENITVQGQTFNHAGFLGISNNNSFFNTGAYSMLHLNGGSSNSAGFRTWMRYGTTITANNDLMYMGVKNNLGLDHTEAVIAWGNDAGVSQYGPDDFVFKFVNVLSGNSAATSVDGQEIARFSGIGNVGIGDFSDNGFGLNETPTHRLDVDGQVRIRTINNDNSPDVLITGSEQDGVGDYVLKRKAFSGNANEYLDGQTTTANPTC